MYGAQLSSKYRCHCLPCCYRVRAAAYLPVQVVVVDSSSGGPVPFVTWEAGPNRAINLPVCMCVCVGGEGGHAYLLDGSGVRASSWALALQRCRACRQTRAHMTHPTAIVTVVLPRSERPPPNACLPYVATLRRALSSQA